MTRCYIVTEGRGDVALLSALLKPEFDPKHGELVIAEGHGYSGADSMARSLLVTRSQPVALVVDADGTSSEERKDFLESLLRRFAPHHAGACL